MGLASSIDTIKFVQRFFHGIRAELKDTIEEDLNVSSDPFELIHEAPHFLPLASKKDTNCLQPVSVVSLSTIVQRFSLRVTPRKTFQKKNILQQSKRKNG